MLFDSRVLVLVLGESPRRHLQVIRNVGFKPQIFRCQQMLIDEAAARPFGAFMPIVIVPAPGQGEQPARLLRQQLGQASIIVLSTLATEPERLRWLQAGADWVCSPQQSPQTLPDVLLALWKRRLQQLPGNGRRVLQGWVLHEYAWALQSPQGLRLTLTAGERAVLMILFSAADQTARHAVLQEALADAYGHAPGGQTSPARLGVVINRLRTKGRRAGVSLPIRAVRGYGYAWGEPHRLAGDNPGPAPA